MKQSNTRDNCRKTGIKPILTGVTYGSSSCNFSAGSNKQSALSL
jgi:hypothetical protein